jgi:hypothetical protein
MYRKFLVTDYSALNAFTIFNLAARIEGKNPPKIPMIMEKINEDIIIVGERVNEKAISENEFQFNVEIEKNCKREAMIIPVPPPIRAINKDSKRNTVSMLLLLKPKARIVPTSTVR